MTAEAAEVMVDFVERPTEPFLGGLEKGIDALKVLYPVGKYSDGFGLSHGGVFNERGQVLKLKYAVIEVADVFFVEFFVSPCGLFRESGSLNLCFLHLYQFFS